jgi:preprotein translocase subunit YajC
VLGNMIIAASKATSKSSGSTEFLLIIVVLIVLFYFLLIRPQRNRARKVQEQQSSVTPGVRVRTTAGMYATVIAVDGNDVVLEVAPGVEVRYLRRAIMEVLPDDSGDGAMPGEADDSAGTAGAHDDSEAGADDESSDDNPTATDETTSRSG